MHCKDCTRLSRGVVICIGLPSKPDPPEDTMRICLLKNGSAKDINMTPAEFKDLYDTMHEVMTHFASSMLALLEVQDEENGSESAGSAQTP